MMTRSIAALLLALSFSFVAFATSPVPASAEDAPREHRTIEIGVPDMH